MNLPALLASLCADEGFVPYGYKDSLGILTIGYGTNIDKNHGGFITKEEAEYLLNNRLTSKIQELDSAIPWWRQLSDARQNVLAEMAYQMGTANLLAFHMMLSYLKEGNYESAANAGLQSEWALVQSPERAERLMRILRTGDIDAA